MTSFGSYYDVIIVGGGNAGLCAALYAAERTKQVLLIEKSPKDLRGGNSKFTRDIRCCQHPDEYATGTYDEQEFLDDIVRVTGGTTNMQLAKHTVHESFKIPNWMEKQGIKWQRALKGTLHLSRTNRFFLGGGKALVNTYYERAAKRRVTVVYDLSVEDVNVDGNHFTSLIATNGESKVSISGKSLILACGGFEANVDWLRDIWGQAANNFVIRGSRSNQGNVLKVMAQKGAMLHGDPKQFHSVAVDARSPKFEGGIITRIDSLPFGIVVNKYAKRFYDEGEDLWPKRYAIWGKLIAEQPDQIAFSVFDSKVSRLFLPTLYPPFGADTISAVAELAGLAPDELVKTVSEYNESVVEGHFDPSVLDSCRTQNISPPKTHWALRIDKPPYYIYPLRPGITFTYMGLTVDEKARVLLNGGRVFDNIYATGEIMAGNILTKGYLAGFGLTIGTVFGWLSGLGATGGN